jgi:hypothetical protein
MAEPQKLPIEPTEPPKIRVGADGQPDVGSVADLLEWFLNFDERTARIRHANSDELFRWKQADDTAQGVGTYPFENAEARFAVGAIQALGENKSEQLLNLWITDVLEALGRARETKQELEHTFNLIDDIEATSLAKAEKLTTNTQKRLYLSCCWLEVLCTAEARFLGYVYQQIYNKPFEPRVPASTEE